MPRKTKDPLKPFIEPIARRFATEVAAAVMDFVETRVKREVERLVGRALEGARPRVAVQVAKPREKSIRPCRVPGCGKPSKGPRFDYFCEEHRTLPDSEKEAIKAQAAKEAEATGGGAEKPKRRQKKGRKGKR